MSQDNGSTTQEGARKTTSPYLVFDLNQRGDKPRQHDVITRLYQDGSPPDTVTYPLYSSNEKGCAMPMEHALKFLCDPAFKVVGPTGNRIMPIPKIDLSKPLKSLAIDEVVVQYKYLSRDYLFRLVKMTAGSEDIKPNASVDELAAFMVAQRKALVKMSDSERHIAEMMMQGGADGAMDQEQLERMFPDTTRKVA